VSAPRRVAVAQPAEAPAETVQLPAPAAEPGRRSRRLAHAACTALALLAVAALLAAALALPHPAAAARVLAGIVLGAGTAGSLLTPDRSTS
jgi:hypothetical protein